MLALALTTTTANAGGDVKAGEQKAQACAACHGPNGASQNAQFPNLAGQVPGYVAKQLALFKSGERANDVMKGLAAPLSEQDMADLDAYFAAQKPAMRNVPEDQAEIAMLGQDIYRGGYEPLGVAPCISCHGPAGHGIPPRFPRVSGQYAEYLEQQLMLFKSGERANDVMEPIAFRLSVPQIKQLALYMSGLQ
jgi:cytochrome c553